ncbi:hypothetical protein LOC68_09150 [Blastopirellula sp. JC732]|uniref:Uncharacterized protein n=1 Tax=Blastopirellula sediminis TaxID=2894196 RepID=A0A9X1MLK0_9BACT|nr:hypothetical protein [Blastopirellula sediminis]MCC9608661.1 hypothetical protein [Blastopirellula sediminis]MCC9628562.1 hypothetical protein [Blastopirellula sediminis]
MNKTNPDFLPRTILASLWVFSILLSGCMRVPPTPLTKDDIARLEAAELFNLAIEKPGGGTAPLTDAEAKAFLRSLASIVDTTRGKLIGSRLRCIVVMQSSKDPLSFFVYDDGTRMMVSVEGSVFLVESDADLRSWLEQQLPADSP